MANQGVSQDEILNTLKSNFPGAKFTNENVKLLIDAAISAAGKVLGKDYIIKNAKIQLTNGKTDKQKQIEIIDENTGFLKRSSRWAAYVHEMLEIKENLTLKRSSVTQCAVAQLCFFNFYRNLCGVTGSTGTYNDHDLFKRFYGLDVFEVPTNLKSNRKSC